jgi:uncharacterized RDD family membrane protein YckC
MGTESVSIDNSENPAEHQLAPRGRRLVARLLDGVWAAVAILPGIAVQLLGLAPGRQDVSPAAVGIMGLGLLAYLVFYARLLASQGQSPGKAALSIRVVAQSSNKPPGFVKAVLIREGVPIGFGLAVAFWEPGRSYLVAAPITGPENPLATFGPIWDFFVMYCAAMLITDLLFIFSPSRRCLHDRISGTRVDAVQAYKRRRVARKSRDS